MSEPLSQRILARFSRVTSSGKWYVPQLDGVRCIAISWVLAVHVAQYVIERAGQTVATSKANPLIYFIDAGRAGVDLFFVISGFVLAIPFARQHLAIGKPVSLKAFFTRRLTRLEPPYIIHLLFTLAMWVVLGAKAFPLPSITQSSYLSAVPSHLVASLFYSHQFIYQAMPFPNIVLWSLEVEVQFYILAPLLALVFAIRDPGLRRAVILGMMAVFAGIAFHWHDNFMVSHSLLGYLQEFLVGFLLVDLYLTRWQDSPARQYVWDVISLLGWVGIVYCDCLGASRFLVLPGAMLMMFAGAFRGAITSRVLGNRWLATLGGMCCTIYMYHGGIILALGHKARHWRTGIMWLDVISQVILLWIACMAICSLLFLAFERPFMRPDWYKRLWARVRPVRRTAESRETAKTEVS
jgi:peptidoglycan/LPS O-acetylase OafA/YrhL